MKETQENNQVRIFLDDDSVPFAEFKTPVKFMLDTTKLVDGEHSLRVVSRSTDGTEGTNHIRFTVRNGPAITVVGLKDGDVVDDKVPLIINAYGSERKDLFIVQGSETPKAVPSWIWVILISFVGWAIFYLIMYWTNLHY
ncbi:MAG TPA: cytochrome C [Cyclobacteriaceae bacterium]|nr:cytochrome C [Cyclobacteriaceae bacterium]